MALNIFLTNEHGDPISNELVDQQVFLANFIKKSQETKQKEIKYLNCIDEYGDTILNHLQIPFFIEELDLFLSPNDHVQEVFFHNLKELATLCQNDVHTYLKFMGN